MTEVAKIDQRLDSVATRLEEFVEKWGAPEDGKELIELTEWLAEQADTLECWNSLIRALQSAKDWRTLKRKLRMLQREWQEMPQGWNPTNNKLPEAKTEEGFLDNIERRADLMSELEIYLGIDRYADPHGFIWKIADEFVPGFQEARKRGRETNFQSGWF